MNIWNCIKFGESTWGAPKSETTTTFGFRFGNLFFLFTFQFDAIISMFRFFGRINIVSYELKVVCVCVCLVREYEDQICLAYSKERKIPKNWAWQEYEMYFCWFSMWRNQKTNMKENVMRKTSIKCSFIEFHWTWYKYYSWKLTLSTMFHTRRKHTLYMRLKRNGLKMANGC